MSAATVQLASQSELELQATGRRARSRRAAFVWLGRLLVVVVVIGGWQWFTSVGWVDKFFYGQPTAIWDSLVTLFTQGTAFGPIWEQIGVTVQEAVLGFLLGTVVGIVFGILLGSNRYLSDVLNPYIKVLNSIPRIVLGSIFIMWLGLGWPSKVLLAAVLVFFVVFFNAFQGVRSVDRNLVANARILGASNRRVTLQVVIPSATSWIFTSLHVSFGFALIGAIVGEYLGATKGIGLLISQSQGTFNTAGVYAAMVILAVVALGAEGLLTFAERRIFRWKPTGSDS